MDLILVRNCKGMNTFTQTITATTNNSKNMKYYYFKPNILVVSPFISSFQTIFQHVSLSDQS